MKFVGLISGGKDSIFNILECISYGHELVCVANLHPPLHQENKELDSYMFQTVGVEVTDYIAQCLEVPIIKFEIKGKSVNQDLYYEKNDESKLIDEVEELFQLVQLVKTQFPEVQAVASGAIFSNYQRLRVENVCQRLGLVSLAYLWLRDQSELLKEMIETQMDARIVKICSMGLKQGHLGKSIASLYDYFITLRDQFQFNVCGEGGEYESAVFDCPIFKNKKIVEVQSDYVYHSKNEIGPVAYLKLNQLELRDKSEEVKAEHNQIMMDLINQRKFIQSTNKSDLLESFNPKPIDVLIKSQEQFEEFKGQQMIFLKTQGLVVTRYVNINDFGVRNSKEVEYSQAQEVEIIFTQLNEIMKKEGIDLKRNAIAVSLFISDMSKFQELNAVYSKFFGLKPPVRACVAMPHRKDQCQIQLSVIFGETNAIDTDRLNLHVQSISQWAPSNIGPYSQANMIRGHLLIAGQIGLIGEHMILPGQFIDQYRYIVKNFGSIIQEVAKRSINKSVINGIVYIDKIVSFDQFVPLIQKDFKNDVPLLLLRTEKLPRNSLLEIELYCHQLQQEGLSTKLVKDQSQIQQTLTLQGEEEEQKQSQVNTALKYMKFFNQIDVQSSDISAQVTSQVELMKVAIKEAFNSSQIALNISIYQPLHIAFDDAEYLRKLISSQCRYFCQPLVSVIPVYECFMVNFGKSSDAIVWTAQYISL